MHRPPLLARPRLMRCEASARCCSQAPARRSSCGARYLRVQEPHAGSDAPLPQDASLGLAEADEGSETVRFAMLDPKMRCANEAEALGYLKNVHSLFGGHRKPLSPALHAAADNLKALSMQGDGLFSDGLAGRWSRGRPYAAPSRVTEPRRMLLMLKPDGGVSPLVRIREVCV